MRGNNYLALNIITCCFFIFTIPMIVMFSFVPREDIMANTRGYIVPGGDCQIICGGIGDFSNCESVGIINVSFYSPENSSQLIYNLAEAPSMCEYETTEMTVCCQNFIEDQTLLWIQVKKFDGNFNITHVSFRQTDNYFNYLIIGLLLASLSLSTGVCCIYIIVDLIKKSRPQPYTIIN